MKRRDDGPRKSRTNDSETPSPGSGHNADRRTTEKMPAQQNLTAYAVLMRHVLAVGAKNQGKPCRQTSATAPQHHSTNDSRCYSKYPRCTVHATAGTMCMQEDHPHQTLTPRGHTKRIECQLLQTLALIKCHFPSFGLNNLKEICAREGLEVDPSVAPLAGYQ